MDKQPEPVVTAPSAADLASAIAFIDARYDTIGERALVLLYGRPTMDGTPLAETIIATARALGWQPPAPTVSPEDAAERAELERIVGVAIRLESSGYELTLSLPKPNRHSDVVSAGNFLGGGALGSLSSNRLQGFITSHGRYVDRREALRIAMLAEQIIKGPAMPHIGLSSEDVW